MRVYCKKLREKLFWLCLDSNKTTAKKAEMLTERVMRHRIDPNPILERIEYQFGQLPNDYFELKKLLEIAIREHKFNPKKLLLVESTIGDHHPTRNSQSDPRMLRGRRSNSKARSRTYGEGVTSIFSRSN